MPAGIADPAQARFDQFAGPPGAPGQFGQPGQLGQPPLLRPTPTGAPEPSKPERKGRLIVGVLIGCVLLLAVAFGGLVLLDRLVGPAFGIGDCVKRSATNDEAVSAPCSEDGAYKVVSSVGSADECDEEQPFVKVGDEILCLQPAIGQPSAPPSTAPTSAPSATP